MKKLFVSVCSFFSVTLAYSQDLHFSEPEFINSYCILTSDSTYDTLPKENGIIGKHENKTKSLLSKIGKVANVASSASGLGAVIGANVGSVDGVLTGIQVASTASSVGSLANSASALAGSSGMDIIFRGKSSSYSYEKNDGDIRLLIKAESNEEDPLGIYRIVKFNTNKKERRIQWIEFDSSFLSSDEASKSGFLNFIGHKYGEQSYLLTIPAEEVEKGEYGIFYMNIITSTTIPVGTFSVK